MFETPDKIAPNPAQRALELADKRLCALLYVLVSEEMPIHKVLALITKARQLATPSWTGPSDLNVAALVDQLAHKLVT